MRIWGSILQGNCSPILELDVRLLNHPNRIYITQVMVPGSLCSRKVMCLIMVFQEFVVCLENVFEMSFVPHLAFHIGTG